MSSLFIKNGYWIPTENEWYKAAYYDPTLNGGNGGYWTYATRSNVIPSAVTANSTGDGSAVVGGNFANYGDNASWDDVIGNVTSVGSNGSSSYYGTFDQGGNVYEWTDAISTSNTRGIRGRSYGSPNGVFLGSSIRLFSINTSQEPGTGFRICTIQNNLSLNNFVTIANIGNANDLTSYGAVNYIYQIGSYEVTNSEYVEFLNTIASTDTYNLYNIAMSDARGGILRSGTNGNYSYIVKTNYGNKPVNYVSWFSCARYCNWLTNGKPNGFQNKNTTEAGAYPLYGATSGIIQKIIK